MFQTLLESRASRARRTWGTAASIGVHTTAIALAIVATARATSAPPAHPPEVSDIVWTAPPLPQRQIADRLDGRGYRALPRTDRIVFTHVPTIEIREPNFSLDPSRVLNKNPFDGPPLFATRLSGEGALVSRGTEGAYTATTVEKAATPRPGNPRPAYPAPLRAAQLEGNVTARFIVDTLGRAEPASIAFPDASHPAFAEAVRQALLRSRYLPAMVDGHPVRQLVEQRFTFALQR